MSTVTPLIVAPGDTYDATSVNLGVQGLTDGYNAIEDDDLARESFGYESFEGIALPVPHPISPTSCTAGTDFVSSTNYPGFGLALDTWDQVVITGVDAKVVFSPTFEVGPTSADKIAVVIVGATFHVKAFGPGNSGYMALAVKHTGNATAEVIPATDFPVSHNDQYSLEFYLTEDDVPVGESIEHVWLVVTTGTFVTRVTSGHLFAIALHSAS